jgi:phosphoribosylanthranilate isomerase
MNKLDKSRYISVNGGWQGLGDGPHYSRYDLAEHAQKAGYKLLYGVQTSEKTQVEEVENKYGRDWYPVGSDFLTNYMDIDGASVLHINSETVAPEAIPFMAKLVYGNAHNSPYFDVQKPAAGVQLNRLPWHELDYTQSLERIARILPVTRIILQASGLQIGRLSPAEFAERLSCYSPYVSTVLLDDSSGTGKTLSPNLLRPYIDAIYGNNDMPSVAVAGGLRPSNVDFILDKLINDYPDLSFDAETGLRENYDRDNPKVSKFSGKKAREFASKIIELSLRDTL